MVTSDHINDLIDDSIAQLSSDEVNAGVDCLIELAHIFAKAGCDIQSFYNIRKHIIDEAIKRTDAFFIETKVQIAERQLRETRNGQRSIIITH